jgi:hypothetical protein
VTLSLEVRVSQKLLEITDRKTALERGASIDNLTWQAGRIARRLVARRLEGGMKTSKAERGLLCERSSGWDDPCQGNRRRAKAGEVRPPRRLALSRAA